MNPAPILVMKGRVHGAPRTTSVPARPAREAGRDESGTFRRALPAQPAYEYETFQIITEDGGFASCAVLPTALAECGDVFDVPASGTEVEWPVRPYVGWAGPDGQRYRVVAYSLAGDVYAARVKAALKADADKTPGARALASTGS